MILSKLKRLFGDKGPHQAPDLEAMLPDVVAGRRLYRWSVHGIDFYQGDPPAPHELEEIEAELTEAGLQLGDMARAVAGRDDPATDPPYLVYAVRIGYLPAEIRDLDVDMDHPGAGTWTSTRVGGRACQVGTESMVEQTDHQRGRPYVYDIGSVRFLVVTDDPDWAAEAIGALRPDPLTEGATLLLELPPGWQPGVIPFATREAETCTRDDPDCVAVAHDSGMIGRRYVPSLTVSYRGPWEGDADELLELQELEFRDPADGGRLRDAVLSATRATLPAGEALRVVLADELEPGLLLTQVQYYVATHAGPFALWFACETDDLPRYEAVFDQTATTFLRPDLDPDGELAAIRPRRNHQGGYETAIDAL